MRFVVVHKLHVVRSLTQRLSKASRGAYSSHNLLTCVLFYFSMHMMYCALRIGSLDNDNVICCMVVPFHISPYCRCITFTTRCAMLS
jgi:hypothetical protein